MSFWGGWLLIAVVIAVLYVYWRLMELTFDMIDRAHDRRRVSESRNAGMPLGSERGD